MKYHNVIKEHTDNNVQGTEMHIMIQTEIENSINVIDCHTAGEPARIVVAGLPEIHGDTMALKRDYFRDNLDHLRRFIIHEPRGHSDMFGVIITAPCDPSADIGVLFIDADGYLNMCGHGTIAVVTALLETSVMKMENTQTKIAIDTPAGLIKTTAHIETDKVVAVTIENVPSFLYRNNIELPVNNQTACVDIAFGGSFFALLSAKSVGLKICPQNIDMFIRYGMDILQTINQNEIVRHPVLRTLNSIDLVEFYDDSIRENDYIRGKNIVIFGNGQYDRSPCGTGTSAKIAMMVAKGELKHGQQFINESVLGTTFVGKSIGSAKVGAYDAVLPSITGSAYITGLQQLVYCHSDPFEFGFNLLDTQQNS